MQPHPKLELSPAARPIHSASRCVRTSTRCRSCGLSGSTRDTAWLDRDLYQTNTKGTTTITTTTTTRHTALLFGNRPWEPNDGGTSHRCGWTWVLLHRRQPSHASTGFSDRTGGGSVVYLTPCCRTIQLINCQSEKQCNCMLCISYQIVLGSSEKAWTPVAFLSIWICMCFLKVLPIGRFMYT